MITLELDLLVVNYHKVHPQSCGDTSFNFVLCIHELQLKGLECKKVFFFDIPVHVSMKEKLKRVTFLTFLCICCAMIIWNVSGMEQVPNLR